jgi:hypothetical protein
MAQARARVRSGAPRIPPLVRLREHRWTPPERAVLISVVAITLASLFVTTYTLALGDPVPHRIDAALVGRPAAHRPAVASVQRVVSGSLVFRRYPSVAAARHAIDLQDVYAALDVASPRPTLFIASAAGASVARVLEKVAVADPPVRVVDTHPLSANDPSGIDTFYLMLVATIVGFITVFQVRGYAGGLALRHWIAFVVALALAASLALTLVDGTLLHRLDLPLAEGWGILALQILTVASFASLAILLVGRWAIIPTWLLFVILGNSSSGGAVAPPLLPHPFALVSQWLPSGATVSALRNAVYFRDYQHIHPIAVLATWAAVMFSAMVVASRRLKTSPGG